MTAPEAGTWIGLAFIVGAIGSLISRYFMGDKKFEDSPDNIIDKRKEISLEDSYAAVRPLDQVVVINKDRVLNADGTVDDVILDVVEVVDDVKPITVSLVDLSEGLSRGEVNAYASNRAHKLKCKHEDGKKCPICDYYKSMAKGPPPLPVPEPILTLGHLHAMRRQAAWNNTPEKDDFFRPTNGDYKIRILPAGPKGLYGTQTHYVARKQHYLDGYPSKNGPVQCPKRMTKYIPMSEGNSKWSGNCPICKHNAQLWAAHQKAKDNHQHDEAEKISKNAIQCKGMDRFYYNVLVHLTEGDEPQLRLWSTGRIVHDQIQAMIAAHEKDDTGDEPNILDLGPDGYCIRVVREDRHRYGGSVGYPDYKIRPSVRPTRAGTKEQVEMWMANLWDLEAVTACWEKTEKELRTALAASAIMKLESRRCDRCGNRLHDDSGPQAIYCSKQCLNLAQQDTTKFASCPVCGENKTGYVGGMYAYLCGFSADQHRLLSRCKHAPKCECYHNKKTGTSIYCRGCLCDAEVDLVGKRTPHPMVGKWRVKNPANGSSPHSIEVTETMMAYNRKESLPAIPYDLQVHEKDQTYYLSGHGSYAGRYKVEGDTLTMRYNSGSTPPELFDGGTHTDIMVRVSKHELVGKWRSINYPEQYIVITDDAVETLHEGRPSVKQSIVVDEANKTYDLLGTEAQFGIYKVDGDVVTLRHGTSRPSFDSPSHYTSNTPNAHQWRRVKDESNDPAKDDEAKAKVKVCDDEEFLRELQNL
jgi:hypothetical protein